MTKTLSNKSIKHGQIVKITCFFKHFDHINRPMVFFFNLSANIIGHNQNYIKNATHYIINRIEKNRLQMIIIK